MNEAYLVEEFGHGGEDAQVALATLQTVWLGALGTAMGGEQGERTATRVG